MRTFIYGLVAETNDDNISTAAFLASCNRYGIDNPWPIVTKRLAIFGNNEDMEKEFKRIIEKYKKEIPSIEPDIIAPGELRQLISFDQSQGKDKLVDFKETEA